MVKLKTKSHLLLRRDHCGGTLREDLRWLRLGTEGQAVKLANEHCTKSGTQKGWVDGESRTKGYSMPGKNLMAFPSLVIVCFLLQTKFARNNARVGRKLYD